MDPTRLDRISKVFAERRLSRRQAVQGAGAIAAGATAAGLTHAAAQEATPAADGGKSVPFMFVQTFGAGAIADDGNGKLTLTADHLAGQTIYFSDRPERIAGMVATETFLGAGAEAAGMMAAATPDAGLGFTPADPPNAALVFASGEGDDDSGDVLVVELIDPTYDPATGKATYGIKVLADDTAVDMTLVAEPISSADAIRNFDAASLFIDDCPDGNVQCYDGLTYVGGFPTTGFCYNWGSACCAPCDNSTSGYWDTQCTNQFADSCPNGCQAAYNETWACSADAQRIG
jgi:hypothetical protein